jgi:hypothetical protein
MVPAPRAPERAPSGGAGWPSASLLNSLRKSGAARRRPGSTERCEVVREGEGHPAPPPPLTFQSKTTPAFKQFCNDA